MIEPFARRQSTRLSTTDARVRTIRGTGAPADGTISRLDTYHLNLD
jgi:hypothetical protein